MSALHPIPTVKATFRKWHVRFTPESGHVQCNSRCPLWANSGQSALAALVGPGTNRFHFPHYLVEIEARWLLPLWEFLEALEPRRSECLHRHLNEGAIYHPFIV